MDWLAIAILAFIVLGGFSVFTGAPYVPSRSRDIKRMFDELYILKPSDVLIDVGSGDGIVLREASRRGAKAIGYEINPFLVALSKWLSRKDTRVAVHVANLWVEELPKDTSVIYAFSVQRDNKKLIKKIQKEANRLNKDLFLISYGNELPGVESIRAFEAYHLYQFHPLQQGVA